MEFYSLKNILNRNAHYNIIIGERSSGKTYASLKYGLENYVKGEGSMAIIRRWDIDFKQSRGSVMFDALVNNDEIIKLTNGKYTSITYKSYRWYLSYKDEDTNTMVLDSSPFAYAFSLVSMEHDKSTSYSSITTIIFDEFLARNNYIVGEFVIFMNTLSTIIRHRNNVKIFMLGNTINQYSPYFTEMGLNHIKDMKPGSIDVYSYGESDLKVAVEFTGLKNKSKPSDIYFAFDTPKLNMITGKGQIWELDIFPHCPVKYKPNDIKMSYFIEFDDTLYQGDIIKMGNTVFTFIHLKTTPIKNPDKDYIYSIENDPRPNHFTRINITSNPVKKFIWSFFVDNKVFYQDNTVGMAIQNYIEWSVKN